MLMSTKSSTNRLNLVVVATVIALLAAAGAGVYYFFNGGLLVSRSSRFYCQRRPDKHLGGDVYTVMYRHDQGRKPWLKMVSTLGDGNWPPHRRCEEIARRLEIFRSDGLLELYSTIDTQLQQHLICARTKNSGPVCELLVTLKPGADPDEELYRMSQSLIPESNVKNNPQGNISSSSQSNSTDRSQPLVVDLRPFLSEEDRQAGEPAQ